MAIISQPYPGVRDVYPNHKRAQSYVLTTMRRVVQQFGYEEYDAPLLEPYPFADAQADASVVVDDRGHNLTLRQALTPTASRMVEARPAEYAYPLRWYSVPTVWHYSWDQAERYEKPELVVDVFGIRAPLAITESIQIVDTTLKAFGATQDQYGVRLSSLELIRYIFSDYLQLNNVQASTICKLIARMPPITIEAFIAELDALFTPTQREAHADTKLLGLLKIKDMQHLPEVIRSQPAAIELKKLMQTLQALHIPGVSFDLSLMPGPDHYSGMVFEVFDTLPTNPHPIASGGHYESARKKPDAKPIEAVGTTFGVHSALYFLEQHNLVPRLTPETDVYVALASDVFLEAQRVVLEIRESEVNAIVDMSGQDIAAQLNTARKKGLRYVIVVHSENLKDNSFELHNLHTGSTERHSLARTISIIKDYRRPHDEDDL